MMALHGGTTRLGVLVTVGPLLVAGCQTVGDSQRTQLEGTGMGAALGALTGYLIGDTKGAALGALIGSGLGFGAGSWIASEKEKYARNEDFYDAQIAQTRQFNTQLVQYNSDLRGQVARYHHEISRLRANAQTGHIDRDAAWQTQRQVQESYTESGKALETAQRELAVQQQVVADARQTAGATSAQASQAQAQVTALSGHINVLRQQVDTLAGQNNQLQQFR